MGFLFADPLKLKTVHWRRKKCWNFHPFLEAQNKMPWPGMSCVTPRSVMFTDYRTLMVHYRKI